MRHWLRLPYPYPDAEPSPMPRPAHISGLALLRGVFLSTGEVRSASDWALVAAGAGFIGLFALSTVLAYAVVYGLGRLFPDVPLVSIYTGSLGTMHPDPYAGWRVGVYVIRFLAFLTLLRLSPISGYHGAEHKVVNAIETTGRLDEGTVRRMPKEHARCGTNLLAGIAPLLIALMPDVSLDFWTLISLLVVGFIIRRQVGWVVQHIFTTREPTQEQLRRGIRSGELLLERWRTARNRPETPARRLWVRGMPQVLIGLSLAMLAMVHLEHITYTIVRYGL